MKNGVGILIAAFISAIITVIIFIFIILPLIPGLIGNRKILKLSVVVIWGIIYFFLLLLINFITQHPICGCKCPYRRTRRGGSGEDRSGGGRRRSP
jgi:hypothetical protein